MIRCKCEMFEVRWCPLPERMEWNAPWKLKFAQNNPRFAQIYSITNSKHSVYLLATIHVEKNEIKEWKWNRKKNEEENIVMLNDLERQFTNGAHK